MEPRQRAGAACAAAAAAGVLAVAGGPAEVDAASHTVTIQSGPCVPTASGSSYCYLPPSLTVSSGDSVVWSNSSVSHTATRCTASACPSAGPGTGSDAAFDTGTIGSGSQSQPVTFHGAGTYNYYCMIHGYSAMHATITVQGSSATPTAQSTTPPPSTPARTPRPTTQTSSSTSSRTTANVSSSSTALPDTGGSASSSSTTTSGGAPVAQATPTATSASGADTGATGAITTSSGSSGGGHGGLVTALAIIGALLAAGAGVVVLRSRGAPPT